MRWASRVDSMLPAFALLTLAPCSAKGLAVLQHSEGCLPFHRIRLVLVEEPSPDKPFDIPLLLDMCGGCFNLTCVLCFYAAVGCWHAC